MIDFNDIQVGDIIGVPEREGYTFVVIYRNSEWCYFIHWEFAAEWGQVTDYHFSEYGWVVL